MSAHTPGPWLSTYSTWQSSEVAEDFKIYANGVCILGSCGCCGGTTLQSKKDALLITSAPELLSALEALVKTNQDHNDAISAISGKPIGWNDEYLNEARAAITKARG